MQRHCRLVYGPGHPDLASTGVRTASNLLVVFPKVMSTVGIRISLRAHSSH